MSDDRATIERLLLEKVEELEDTICTLQNRVLLIMNMFQQVATAVNNKRPQSEIAELTEKAFNYSKDQADAIAEGE